MQTGLGSEWTIPYSDLDAIHIPAAGFRPPASWGVQVNANFDAVYDDVLAKLGVWSTYTPTWTQSATITKTVTRSEYVQLGKIVTGVVSLSATSAGTASNAILITNPVTAKWASNTPVGAGYHYNGVAEGAINIPVIVYLSSTTQFAFLVAATASTGGYGAGGFYVATGAASNTLITPTIASGESMTFHYSYEAA